MKNISMAIKKALPYVLTIGASVGSIATAVSSAKQTKIFLDRTDDKEKKNASDFIKAYYPTIILGTVTIGCMLGATVLNKKQQATIMSAYGLASTTFNRYKNKLKELFGQEAHEKIIEELEKEDAENVSISAPVLMGSCQSEWSGFDQEKRTFYIPFMNKYFVSTPFKVLEAEYHLNRNYCLGADISLNDVYEFLGLAREDASFNDIGWSLMEGVCWMDFDHYTIKDEKTGEDIFVIDFAFDPIPFDQYE